VEGKALEADGALSRTREVQVVLALDERDLERLGLVPPSNGVKDWHGLWRRSVDAEAEVLVHLPRTYDTPGNQPASAYVQVSLMNSREFNMRTW
jgi:hypothetical protein